MPAGCNHSQNIYRRPHESESQLFSAMKVGAMLFFFNRHLKKWVYLKAGKDLAKINKKPFDHQLVQHPAAKFELTLLESPRILSHANFEGCSPWYSPASTNLVVRIRNEFIMNISSKWQILEALVFSST